MDRRLPMTDRITGKWIALSAIFLLLIAAYVEAAEQKIVMEIEGMTCELCTLAIKKSLEETMGVRSVKVSFKDKKAWLTTDETVTDEALIDAVQKSGPYKGKIVEKRMLK
jgi:mercuric ion binding protein